MKITPLYVIIIIITPVFLFSQTKLKSITSKNISNVHKTKVIKNNYEADEIELGKLINPIYESITFNSRIIEEKGNTLRSILNFSDSDKIQSYIDSVNTINKQLSLRIFDIQLNFIKKNPSSFFCLDQLSLLLKNNPDFPNILDSMMLAFHSLNKIIQNSFSGNQFKKLISKLSESSVGKMAPDFCLKDINNNDISVSQYRNRNFVLLDFWASWCKPCREEVPYLKTIYNKYKRKGLEIIGVSRDQNSLLWKKAVIDDGIDIWKNILNSNSTNKDGNSVIDKYFIYGIPVKILISKNGVIVGRWIGGGKDNQPELNTLLNLQ